ncbi:MAG: DUF952 domain-containing protein [Chloroflexota bacterium]
MGLILHMLARSEWNAVKNGESYSPESIEEDGFIHFSQVNMITTVANALYVGQQDMVVLVVDESKINAELIYEDCYETGHAFPHVYGPLNLDAVNDVVDFPCNENGEFDLPEPLQSLLKQ